MEVHDEVTEVQEERVS